MTEPVREWRYRCGRCGNMTDGHREGGEEHCTCCGGVLGSADEAKAERPTLPQKARGR